MEFIVNRNLIPDIDYAVDKTRTFFRKCYVGDELEFKLSILGSPLEMWGPCPAVLLCHEWWQSAAIRDFKRRELFEREIKDLKTSSSQNKKWMFVTIGFDDKMYSESEYYGIMMDCVQRLQKRKFHTDFQYVIEKHRRDASGQIYVHHHVHILMVTDEAKSKVIQYCFEVFKKHIAGKNFIDVKTEKDRVGTFEDKIRYINGDKQSSKLECVELDRQWRAQYI